MPETSSTCPKVSVVMPVYNAEKDLRQCLDSLLKQTMGDFELICVDDGSKDSSPAILSEYAGRDARIRVVTQQNAGAGAARNNGMSHASGEYLAILDCDDFYERTMLERAYAKAVEEDLDIVVFRCDSYIEPDGHVEPCDYSINASLLPETQPFAGTDVPKDIFKLFVGWSWDKLFKRSFVEGLGLQFQEQRTTNDMLFVFSAVAKAGRIATMDAILAHHRRDSGSGSLSVTREKSWHCFYDALCALREQLLAWGLYDRFEQDFVNYAVHFSLWNLRTLAEPTHSMLAAKLHDEWLDSLQITRFDKDYFYNRGEYHTLLEMTRPQTDDAAKPAEVEDEAAVHLANALEVIRRGSGPELRDAYEEARAYFTTGAGAALTPADFSKPEDALSLRVLRERGFSAVAELGKPRLIATMTSFPARIATVSRALRSVVEQTCPPDEVVLWLAAGQFPGKEAELPFDLRLLIARGQVTVKWCDEDLRPHKKYYYALEEYPDDILITVDDDVLYPARAFERLYASYLLFPEAVSASRVHLITFDEEGVVNPYNLWFMESRSLVCTPSMQLMGTGAGGILYPPHVLPDHVRDIDAIRATCLDGDDLWLKAAEADAGVPTVLPTPFSGLTTIAATQDVGLTKTNVEDDGNDVQLAKIEAWYAAQGRPSLYDAVCSFDDEALTVNSAFCEFIKNESAENQARLRALNEQHKRDRAKLLDAYSKNGRLEWQVGDLENQLSLLENSMSFKVGRKITAPARKARDVLKRDGS